MAGMLGGAIYQYQDEYERKMTEQQYMEMQRGLQNQLDMQRNMLKVNSPLMFISEAPDPKAQDKRLLLLEV